jgi:hypothetical protein
MGPKSDNLFHFTKSVDHLKGILQIGFLPRYCLEDTGYLSIDYIGYPMICFCDIPISRIGDHTAFYGDYGLGMTKEWGIRNNLAPLLYTPASGALTDLATYLYKVDMKDADGKNTAEQNELNKHFFRIIPMIKPVSGNMVVGGTIVEKDFHQENEWRFVPQNYRLVFKDKFDEDREKLNASVAEEKLSFLPSDVKYIFVKSDAEIPAIFDFIQNNLGHFPLNEIKILSSRIVSLETLSLDM